jgi:transcriptional regulator with XRE-family HTH domain
LGYEMRTLRASLGWTLEELGRRIGYTAQHISAAEHAQSCISKTFVDKADRALGADGRLSALLPDVVVERAFTRAVNSANACSEADTVDDDVKRRAFLGLGLAVVLLGPEAVARASTDDWERITHAWSYEITAAADRSALLPGLRADLKRLSAQGGPQRAIAQLSSYAAKIALSSGDPQAAHRWWRRAHAAAEADGDPHLLASIAGFRAVEGVFGLYSPDRVVALSDQALAVTGAPCTGRMHAWGARARALALLGRKRETRDAIRELEVTFERLPRDITREKLSDVGFPEERLHNIVSFAGAFAGIGGGEPAREEALRLYSSALWRGPTQVRLHRAMAEADPHLALDALAPLSDPQRQDRFVRLMGLKVLDACDAGGARVADLREVLA